MGYWSIVIEGSGAHHNPDYVTDANRMADDFVIRMKAAGHDIKRAAFLYDYMGDAAGQTLPYLEKPWPHDAPETVFEEQDGPWSVVRIPGGAGVAQIFHLAQNGKLGRSSWWGGSMENQIGTAKHWNQDARRAAAKEAERQAGLKHIEGGSRDDISEEMVDGVQVRRLTQEDGCVTTYWDRPAEGVVYRGRSDGRDREGVDHHDPIEWEETYDLDLGDDVLLGWVYGGGEPEGSQPIGAHIHYREPLYPSGWGGGGMTFSHADERWRSYEQDGVKKYRPTWDVQAWTPLTVTPSLLIHGHETGHGRTPDKHGFVTAGRWVPA